MTFNAGCPSFCGMSPAHCRGDLPGQDTSLSALPPDVQSASQQPQMEGFAVMCPLVPDASHRLSGFCSSPRRFFVPAGHYRSSHRAGTFASSSYGDTTGFSRCVHFISKVPGPDRSQVRPGQGTTNLASHAHHMEWCTRSRKCVIIC